MHNVRRTNTFELQYRFQTRLSGIGSRSVVHLGVGGRIVCVSWYQNFEQFVYILFLQDPEVCQLHCFIVTRAVSEGLGYQLYGQAMKDVRYENSIDAR